MSNSTGNKVQDLMSQLSRGIATPQQAQVPAQMRPRSAAETSSANALIGLRTPWTPAAVSRPAPAPARNNFLGSDEEFDSEDFLREYNAHIAKTRNPSGGSRRKRRTRRTRRRRRSSSKSRKRR